MHKYRLVAKKGEGTFSEVMKAQSVVTGEYVAIKCMKNTFKSVEQVNSLREIQALRRLNPNENIIDLEEVLYDQKTGRLALVFELMDMNIYEMIRGRKQYVKPEKVRMLMYQLCKAVAHMHSNGIFHRDIKPENILVMSEQLKVADFGSCRGIYSKPPYTEYISTRWYRAPECLLTNGWYDSKMDIWGVGCVFFEVVSLFPLFPGTNELDQIEKIHNVLGTPPPDVLELFKKHSTHLKSFNFPPKEGTGIARLIPHASPECIDLIQLLLIYNPEKRITAQQALRHPYFRELREAEQRERIRTASPKLTGMPTLRPGALPQAAAAAAAAPAGNGSSAVAPAAGGAAGVAQAGAGAAAGDGDDSDRTIAADSVPEKPPRQTHRSTKKLLPQIKGGGEEKAPHHLPSSYHHGAGGSKSHHFQSGHPHPHGHHAPAGPQALSIGGGGGGGGQQQQQAPAMLISGIGADAKHRLDKRDAKKAGGNLPQIGRANIIEPSLASVSSTADEDGAAGDNEDSDSTLPHSSRRKGAGAAGGVGGKRQPGKPYMARPRKGHATKATGAAAAAAGAAGKGRARKDKRVSGGGKSKASSMNESDS